MADSKRICSIDGCGKFCVGRGLCDMHYRRMRRHGDTSRGRIKPPTLICSVDGCNEVANRPGSAKGMCSKHYNRSKRHGSPLAKTKSAVGENLQWVVDRKGHQGDECLIVPFASGASRGKVTMQGAEMNASRAMCILAHGEPPSAEHYACHTCRGGDAGCVNPRHLYWGTPKQNQADRVKDGTMHFGPAHVNSKLTENDVREIRALAGTMSQREIGKRFGIGQMHAGRIIRREQWAWLE